MTTLNSLYKAIVADLAAAGRLSPYRADANEPDPRYKGYGVRAPEKNRIIQMHKAAIQALTVEEQLQLAQRLVQSKYGEQQSVAFYILEQMSDYFIPNRFGILDEIGRNLHGWSKIDAFTGALLREVLFRHPEAMIDMVRHWNQDEDLWLRRANVVLFTRRVAKSGVFNDVALEFCDQLMHDPEPLVLKGVGWCLKDLMKSDKPRLIEHVKRLRAQGVPSVVTLYAIRDLKGLERAAILARH